MKAELQQHLYERYPKIFANTDKDIAQSCMAWGIECGDGWFALLNQLCHFLQFYTDHNNVPQVVAEQVKEKFGGLRFYARGGNEFAAGAISFAENMSNTICETCGKPGERNSHGWLITLCDEHKKERNDHDNDE